MRFQWKWRVNQMWKYQGVMNISSQSTDQATSRARDETEQTEPKDANIVRPFIYFISTALSGNPCLSTWREFRIQECILLDSCQYQNLSIIQKFTSSDLWRIHQQSIKGSLCTALIWFPLASKHNLNTQGNNRVKMHYTFVSLSFTTTKRLLLLCHVNQGQSEMFVHHDSRRKKKNLIR